MSSGQSDANPCAQAMAAAARAAGLLAEAEAIVKAVVLRHPMANERNEKDPFFDMLANAHRELDFGIARAQGAVAELAPLAALGVR
jgi:hypothetical protein